MTTYSGSGVMLERLYVATRDGFRADNCATPNDFGWRAPSYQTREIESRVCWVPGDATNGDAGEIDAPFKPGRAPERPLDSFWDLFTIFCYAVGPMSDDLTDELAQYRAARQLFRYFYKRLFHAAYDIGLNKRFVLRRAAWVNDKKERPHGATLRLLFALQDDIPDDAFVFAPEPVTAILDTGIATRQPDGSEPITTSDGAVTFEPEE